MSSHLFHKSTDEIYTPIRDAIVELERRRNDKELQKKVAEFFGNDMYKAVADSPRAVLSRPVATPNFETANFLLQADMIGLDPLIVEFPGKLTAKNKDKYHACMIYTRNGKTKSGLHIVKKEKIVDISKHEGDDMQEVVTSVSGKSLIALHHEMFRALYPDKASSIVDFSEWFTKTRSKADYYYLYYLALFITNGILFENYFFDDKEEGEFIYKKFMPSFERACEIFGVKPLIVPLLPLENERSHAWLYYPETVQKLLYN